MIHNYGYLIITLITQDKTLVDDIKNAAQVEVLTARNHDNSRVINLRQKIVIIDHDSVPVTQEKLKEWADNSQFLILLLADNQSELINEFQKYISDVWYKPINSIVLAKRLSMLGLFQSQIEGVSEYIGVVNHEIKVPLSSISGYSDVLLSGQFISPLTEQQHKFVSVIRKNVSRINILLDNIRTYSQTKYNRLAFNFEVISITTLLHEISNSSEPLYDFKLYQEDDLPEIYADKYCLTQIIEMFLIATKFEDSERTELHIYQVGNFINFSVSSEKMFITTHSTGFYSYHVPFAEYIIPHIIEAHKGTMQIETSPETGSKFSFTIPIAKNHEV